MFENKIYIDDHSSKFGTLVKITHPVIMEEDLIMPFQSGRTVFKAKIHNSFLMSKNILNFEKYGLNSSHTLISNNLRKTKKVQEEDIKSNSYYQEIEIPIEFSKGLKKSKDNYSKSDNVSVSRISLSPSKNETSNKFLITSNRFRNLFKKINLFEGSSNHNHHNESFKPNNLKGDTYCLNISDEEENKEI